MPSFDIVSEIEKHLIINTIDNAKRVLDHRFDFKGSNASINFDTANSHVEIKAESDFQLNQLLDILFAECSKKSIERNSLEVPEKFEHHGKTYSKKISFKQGIDSDTAKKINKLIKESKLKVTSQIQGEQIRVTGKSINDLQEIIALVKAADLGQAFQFINFRN